MMNEHPEKAEIDHSDARAWIIWGLAAIAFGYAFIHRVAPGVMVQDLMAEFSLGGAMLGVLSALYFYPYVLLQVPLGAALSIIGTRLILTGALSLAAIGSLIFGIAEVPEVAYLGRVLIGIGSSVGFLGSLALAGAWFPPDRFAFLAGFTMFFGMISGVFGQGPLAVLVETFGWRSCMIMLAVAGAVLAAVVFALVRNAPKVAAISTGRPPLSATWMEMRENLRLVLCSKKVWAIAFVAATMSGPMLTLGALWGTPYLISAYGLQRPEAASLVSLLLIGWAVSAPLSGRISDRLGRRKPMLVTGLAGLVFLVGVIVILPDLPLALTISLLVLTGVFGAAMTSTFALVREVMPERLAGASVGIVNSMTVASGAVLQPIVGLGLDLSWSGQMIDGARYYAPADYRLAFGVILLSCILGLITAIRLPEAEISPDSN
ncbi:nitrate/nitrite transporter [Alphaproteobacteria bacterium LSUCC0684]